MSCTFICPAAASPHTSEHQPSRAVRGQASVEFVGTLPLLMLGLMVIVQGFLLGTTEVLAQSAAEQFAHTPTHRHDIVQSVPAAWRHGMHLERRAHHVRVKLLSPVVIPGLPELSVAAASEEQLT